MVGRTHARIKGGPSQYSTLKRLLRSPFSGSQDRLVVEPRPPIEDVFENSTRFLRMYPYTIMGRRPPGFFWLFAIRELVSNKPCAILAN